LGVSPISGFSDFFGGVIDGVSGRRTPSTMTSLKLPP